MVMSAEIVVGLDASASSRAALRWAAAQARLTGARLRVIHVLPWFDPSTEGTQEHHRTSTEDVELTREDIEDAHWSTINGVFQAVRPKPTWVLQFSRGEVGRVLVNQSRKARLLVVGTREHKDPDSVALSSVSHYCLNHADTPVVAVPTPHPSPTNVPESLNIDAPDPGPNYARVPIVTSDPGRVVVVGVDASAESLAAARYGVQAAGSRGVDLLLAHAYRPVSIAAGGRGEYGSPECNEASHVVEWVAARLRVPPNLRVHLLTEAEQPAALLERLSRQAALVVVGQDRLTMTQRLVFGRVASQVVQRAVCPVAVVPTGWCAPHGDTAAPVVAALSGETVAEPAVTLAFAEARLRRSSLLALRAEPDRSSLADVAAAEAGIAPLLAGLQRSYPDVSVETAVVSGDPEAALTHRSRSASALVVDHPHRHGWGWWTRSAAQTVFRQAHCPLLIAPASGAATPELAASPGCAGARSANRSPRMPTATR